VKGRENYLILKKIAESLEIQRVYTNMKKLNPEILNNNSTLVKYKGEPQIEKKNVLYINENPKHDTNPKEITLEG